MNWFLVMFFCSHHHDCSCCCFCCRHFNISVCSAHCFVWQLQHLLSWLTFIWYFVAVNFVVFFKFSSFFFFLFSCYFLSVVECHFIEIGLSIKSNTLNFTISCFRTQTVANLLLANRISSHLQMEEQSHFAVAYWLVHKLIRENSTNGFD